LFFGSLIALVAGAVMLGVAGALAIGNGVFVMDGPDVVGINAGSLGWTLIGLMGLAGLVLTLAAVAQVVAWIGTVLNTATRPDKTWFVRASITASAACWSESFRKRSLFHGARSAST